MCSLGLPENMEIAGKHHISFDDNLPLHDACQWKLSLTLIKLMEQVWPDTLHLHSIWAYCHYIMLASMAVQMT